MNKNEEFVLEEETGPMPKKQAFWVGVTVHIPYPKDMSYTIEASSAGTAANRAIKKARKELSGKRIQMFTIKVTRIK